jgi:ribosome-binding protein aMBF1 (putative translation factor)
MSPEQCRAARAWLDWSQEQLATKAQVSNSTLRDFEAGRRVPIANNLTAIKRALEAAGIQFLFSEKKPWGIAERGAASDKQQEPTPRNRKDQRA